MSDRSGNKYAQLDGLATAMAFGPGPNDGGGTTDYDVDVPRHATSVMLQAQTQNVRYRCDGGTPTASVGILLVAGEAPHLIVGKQAIRSIKAIQVAATAKLDIQFLGSE